MKALQWSPLHLLAQRTLAAAGAAAIAAAATPTATAAAAVCEQALAWRAARFSSSSAAAALSYSVAHLASRGVISIQGEDAVEFMQGMTTNDMRPLAQAGAGPVYSVLLTAKGKYLHDLFAYSLPANDTQQQHLLLDVHAGSVGAALAWLGRYKLRRKLQLADASRQYSVWAAFSSSSGGDAAPAPGAAAALHPLGPWRQDPRHPALGLRGVFDAQQLPPPPGAAGGTSSRKQLAAGMAVEHEWLFRRLRWSLGIAEGDDEMPSGQVAPLECNLDALSGISYSKGCYIGQERNSFTHFRGVIRRRVMPLQLLGSPQQQLPACPLPIVAAPGKPPVGLLTAADPADGTGIGLVRLSAARQQVAAMDAAAAAAAGAGAAAGGGQAAAAAGQPLLLELPAGAGVVGLQPLRPAWWPLEWGREEDTGSTTTP